MTLRELISPLRLTGPEKKRVRRRLIMILRKKSVYNRLSTASLLDPTTLESILKPI
jgi:hypothetical protein